VQLRATPRAPQRRQSESTRHDHVHRLPFLNASRFLSLSPAQRALCSRRYQHGRRKSAFHLQFQIPQTSQIHASPACFAAASYSTSLSHRHRCGTRPAQIPIAEHVARRGPASAPKSRFRPLEVFVRRPPASGARFEAAGIRKPSHELTYALQQITSYSMTSSAVASSVGGTVRPSSPAVSALMTNSN
jgi:hypothetical protein